MYFVYAQFEIDGEKQITTSEYVKNFSPQDVYDFDPDSLYLVYWAGDDKTDGDFYSAKLIHMTESMEEMEIYVMRRSKPAGGQSAASKKRKLATKKQPTAKKTKKVAQHAEELRLLDSMSSSSDELVSKKELETIKEKYEKLLHENEALKKANLELQRVLCSKLFKLEKVVFTDPLTNVVAENGGDDLGPVPSTQNVVQDSSEPVLGQVSRQSRGHSFAGHTEVPLPQPVISACPDNHRMVSYDASRQISDAGTSFGIDASLSCPPDEVQDPAEGGATPCFNVESSTTAIGEEDSNGQVHAGRGVWMPKVVWDKIHSYKEDSMFIKQAALAIWSAPVLATKSVTGTLSNRAKADGCVQVQQPLTPHKLEALYGMFERRHGCTTEQEQKMRRRTARYFLSQKMSDLRRKK
ncbi:BEN domain-containing protein 5-like [Ornithodoros turicata]|uniref:BEN domain-containing protein 5-like n=1 Tax=Ornithodoros turicata TaxID=34597 RepID=UPI003138E3D4